LNFSCDNCGRKYSVADDRVGDKGVKIRCKHCQHLIVVKPPPVLESEESTRMVSLGELERSGVAGPRSEPASGGGKGGQRASAKGSQTSNKGSQRTEVGAPPSPSALSTTSPGASPWEGEATRAVVAPDPNAQWFAMVKGQQVGPFDLRGLSGKMKQGEVGLKTFVWREGMDDWKRAEELPELALMFAGGMAKEERKEAAAKVEAVKSIAAALQKSAAAGMRTSAPKPVRPGEPVEEPRRVPVAEASPDEMWPAESTQDGRDAAGPVAFDLSVDGSDAPEASADDIQALGDPPELDLMATASTATDAQAAPVTPPPSPALGSGPAPAMSSAAAVTVTPGPTRRSPKKSRTPAPAPKADEAAADASSSSVDLSADLFSDLDLRRSGEHKAIDPGDLVRTKDEPAPNGSTGEAQANPVVDPFSKMGAIPKGMLPKANESTSYVIDQAGVNRRNPLWKIALFVVLLLALPVGALYGLSELNVVPLEVTRVDEATGEEVKEKVFSRAGVNGLRDLLMGKRSSARPRKDPDPSGAGEKGPDSKDARDKAPATGAAPDKKLESLYQEDQKKDVGPSRAPALTGDSKEQGKDEPIGGPPKEEINKVVEATQRAFQFCIEQELKKNPGFKGGKVRLVATVGSSGVVKKATIDRQDIDQSDLGECLKGRARRMSFSAFSGDDVDLEIPLILSTAM